jgi:hypothetical protein
MRCSIGFAIVVVVLALGCGEATAPRQITLRPDKPSSHDVVESSGFYDGHDGYWYWDGQPPQGDQGPAVITRATTNAWAPAFFSDYGWIGSRVTATMTYSNGDQGRIQLVYSAYKDGMPIYDHGEKDTGWVSCSFIGNGHCQNQDLFTSKEMPEVNSCGVTLTAGGTANARKTLPFGMQLGIPVKTFGNLPIASEWGAADPQPLEASSEDGPPCDNPPPPARPAGPTECTDSAFNVTPCNTDGSELGFGGMPQVELTGQRLGTSPATSPILGTYVECEGTDWYGSNDGGQTWKYLYHSEDHCVSHFYQ